MDKDTQISVIIPVYNGALYLAEAIESVLQQTCNPLEILIVDDGSTDDSAQIAQHYVPAVQIILQAHKGQSAARNLGVTESKGKFLAFLDADDVWMPEKLAEQMAFLDNQLEKDMVFGHVEQFISPELTDALPPLQKNRRYMNGYHVGAMLIRRAAFDRAGLFPTDRRVGEFLDWFARGQELGLKCAMLTKTVMRRRLHLTNLMRREHETGIEYLRILKSALDRRRRKSYSTDFSNQNVH